MGSVTDALESMEGRRIYFDANVFIYFLDDHPTFASRVEPLVRAAFDGRLVAVTSDAAVAEVMVRPYQIGNPIQIREIQAFFSTINLLEIRSHSSEDFDAAARLRAGTGMKFIDALHYATALNAGCTHLVTNDADLVSTTEVTIVQVSSLQP